MCHLHSSSQENAILQLLWSFNELETKLCINTHTHRYMCINILTHTKKKKKCFTHTCPASYGNELHTEPHIIIDQLMISLGIMLLLLLDRQTANCSAQRQRMNFLIFILYKLWPQFQGIQWHFESMLLSIPIWNEPDLKLRALLMDLRVHTITGVARFLGLRLEFKMIWQTEEVVWKENK